MRASFVLLWLLSFACGVGHEVQSLTGVRRTDAVCAQYRHPAGVTFSFQVSLNKVPPAVPNRSFNLLAKDDCRTTLADEGEEGWPEVAVVGFALSFCAEGA